MPNPSNDDEAQSHLRVGHGQETTQLRDRNAGFQPAKNGLQRVNLDVENSDVSCSKRRKFVSEVRADSTKDAKEDEREWVMHYYSTEILIYSSKNRSANCTNHLERRQTRKNSDGDGDGDGDKPNDTSDSTTRVGAEERYAVDQDELKHLDLAQMIVKHGITSLNSIKADILHVYNAEKEKLRRCVNNHLGQFNLTIECLFRSSDNHMYCCLRVQFIDDSWELNNKVIGFKYVRCDRFPREMIENLLSDWNIKDSIIAVHVHAIENGKMKCSLRHSGLRSRYGVLDISTLAYVLDDTFRGGTELAFDILQKIRKLFDYIRETSSHEQKFQIAVEKAKSRGKKVTSQCVPLSSISDLELIKSAVGLREAFNELQKLDPYFKSLNLKTKEWDEVMALYECWELSNDASSIFRGDKCLTANEYFSKVCEIDKKLNRLVGRWNSYVSEGVISVRIGFSDEWISYGWVLGIAAVLDPRFKMNIIKFWYKKIYDKPDRCISSFQYDKFMEVFDRYKSGYSNNLKMLDQFGRPQVSSQHFDDADELPMSELFRYLKEPKYPLVEDFDILTWWRANSPRFPVLARIARDFLAISYSTVVSDSVLWTEIENVIGSEDLDSDIREALLCTRSWTLLF